MLDLAIAFQKYFQYVNMTRLDIEFMKRINIIMDYEIENLKAKKVMTMDLKNLLNFKNNIWYEWYITELDFNLVD